MRRPSSSPGWRGQLRAGLVGLPAASLIGLIAWGAESVHTVPHVPSASSEGHAGVVRIESRSGVSGSVRVVAVDDAGWRVEAGRLTLGAGAAVEFEIGAMESGDASLGLAGTGPGQGDWRLELSTELDIEARAYARSEDFLTALHDAAPLTGEVELPFFNPGGAARRSVLRLANARGERARLTVRGVDDAGRAGGALTVELAAWEARSYTASELESGAASGLTGSLGDGDGRWRLTLSADQGSAYVTNLLDGSGVLSSVPGGMSRGSGGVHRVSLFPSASDGAGRRGAVRVVNRSPESAEVGIDAFDATDRAYERLRLTLAGESSARFDSTDLEQGNSEKGLTGSTGSGEGDWWLELASESDIEVLSYVDTATGPLSAVRGTAGVETDTGMRYEAVLLAGESGELRLLNPGGAAVEVRVTGTDDAGASGGEVEVTLAPWVARTLTATALAEGSGVRGALGAGTGSWRLRLESDGEIDVLSLVRGAGGMLSDVSRRGRPAGAPPRTEVIDATASEADLRVVVSASEAELSPGEAFELTATVSNVGDRRASATTLRYRRSADAAITTGDTEVGTEPVAALAAAQSITRSLSLSAPTAPGTYHYGACADAVPEETNTANNCSAAVAVRVTEPVARPDLTVESPSVSDARPDTGASFTFSATVRNAGDSSSAATTLRYRRSADATITTSDTQVGTDAVDELVASGMSAESIALTAPSTSGAYYYGACVDAVPEESDVANNCSMGVGVTVAERPTPDLAVSASSSAVGREASCNTRDPAMSTSATVRNAGAGNAPATTLRYYRSSDATASADDAEFGSVVVPALAASGSWGHDLESDLISGTHYYYACADPAPIEQDKANNCSEPQRIATSALSPPDLTMIDFGVVPYDDRLSFSVWVKNLGDGVATGHRTRVCGSTDRAFTRCETILLMDNSIPTGGSISLRRGCRIRNAKKYLTTIRGTFYFRACIEDVTPEDANPENDCSQILEVVR